jgi:hypothetical protein
MKKILISILAITLVLAFTTPNQVVQKTEYHKGWDDGHCEGWKDEMRDQRTACPFPPQPGYPVYPKSVDSYKDGYNDGFKRGIADAKDSPYHPDH